MKKLQVSYLGLNSLFGKVTSSLLRQSPCIERLTLYDDCESASPNLENLFFGKDSLLDAIKDVNIVVIGDEISEVHGEQRLKAVGQKIFRYTEAILKSSPNAIVVVAATPTNIIVPLIGHLLGPEFRSRLLGMTSVDTLRASCILNQLLNAPEGEKHILPIVGGSSVGTRIPLFSQLYPELVVGKEIQQNVMEKMMTFDSVSEISTIERAHSTVRFITSIITGATNGRPIPEVAMTKTCNVPELDFLSMPVYVGRNGVEKVFPLPKLTGAEEEMFAEAVSELGKDSKIALQLAANLTNDAEEEKMSRECEVNDVLGFGSMSRSRETMFTQPLTYSNRSKSEASSFTYRIRAKPPITRQERVNSDLKHRKPPGELHENHVENDRKKLALIREDIAAKIRMIHPHKNKISSIQQNATKIVENTQPSEVESLSAKAANELLSIQEEGLNEMENLRNLELINSELTESEQKLADDVNRHLETVKKHNLCGTEKRAEEKVHFPRQQANLGANKTEVSSQHADDNKQTQADINNISDEGVPNPNEPRRRETAIVHREDHAQSGQNEDQVEKFDNLNQDLVLAGSVQTSKNPSIQELTDSPKLNSSSQQHTPDKPQPVMECLTSRQESNTEKKLNDCSKLDEPPAKKTYELPPNCGKLQLGNEARSDSTSQNASLRIPTNQPDKESDPTLQAFKYPKAKKPWTVYTSHNNENRNLSDNSLEPVVPTKSKKPCNSQTDPNSEIGIATNPATKKSSLATCKPIINDDQCELNVASYLNSKAGLTGMSLGRRNRKNRKPKPRRGRSEPPKHDKANGGADRARQSKSLSADDYGSASGARGTSAGEENKSSSVPTKTIESTCVPIKETNASIGTTKEMKPRSAPIGEVKLTNTSAKNDNTRISSDREVNVTSNPSRAVKTNTVSTRENTRREGDATVEELSERAKVPGGEVECCGASANSLARTKKMSNSSVKLAKSNILCSSDKRGNSDVHQESQGLDCADPPNPNGNKIVAVQVQLPSAEGGADLAIVKRTECTITESASNQENCESHTAIEQVDQSHQSAIPLTPRGQKSTAEQPKASDTVQTPIPIPRKFTPSVNLLSSDITKSYFEMQTLSSGGQLSARATFRPKRHGNVAHRSKKRKTPGKRGALKMAGDKPSEAATRKKLERNQVHLKKETEKPIKLVNKSVAPVEGEENSRNPVTQKIGKNELKFSSHSVKKVEDERKLTAIKKLESYTPVAADKDLTTPPGALKRKSIRPPVKREVMKTKLEVITEKNRLTTKEAAGKKAKAGKLGRRRWESESRKELSDKKNPKGFRRHKLEEPSVTSKHGQERKEDEERKMTPPIKNDVEKQMGNMWHSSCFNKASELLYSIFKEPDPVAPRVGLSATGGTKNSNVVREMSDGAARSINRVAAREVDGNSKDSVNVNVFTGQKKRGQIEEKLDRNLKNPKPKRLATVVKKRPVKKSSGKKSSRRKTKSKTVENPGQVHGKSRVDNNGNLGISTLSKACEPASEAAPLSVDKLFEESSKIPILRHNATSTLGSCVTAKDHCSILHSAEATSDKGRGDAANTIDFSLRCQPLGDELAEPRLLWRETMNTAGFSGIGNSEFPAAKVPISSKTIKQVEGSNSGILPRTKKPEAEAAPQSNKWERIVSIFKQIVMDDLETNRDCLSNKFIKPAQSASPLSTPTQPNKIEAPDVSVFMRLSKQPTTSKSAQAQAPSPSAQPKPSVEPPKRQTHQITPSKTKRPVEPIVREQVVKQSPKKIVNYFSRRGDAYEKMTSSNVGSLGAELSLTPQTAANKPAKYFRTKTKKKLGTNKI